MGVDDTQRPVATTLRVRSRGACCVGGPRRENEPGRELEVFADKSVLISSDRQLPAVLALLELDGIASRILLCPPDQSPAHLSKVIADARVDVIVTDGTGPAAQSLGVIELRDTPAAAPDPAASPPGSGRSTEWLLFTSGTTGCRRLSCTPWRA